MNILVTGGAGYVGSACLRHLVGKGYHAIAYDNLYKGHAEAIPAGCLVRGDIHDTGLLVRTLREHSIDAVMHFAAATDVGESVLNPEYHYHNNISGTLSLLRALRETGIQRLLFSSTCATYGDNPTPPMNEEAAQIPCSPYARTKLAVEWMIRDFAEAYGLGFTLLRYFNACGADAHGEYGENHEPEFHLIPIVLQIALGQRDHLSLYGDDYPTPDGTCVRDYVHTEDLAQAHRLAIEATYPSSRQVFNVGTGVGHSVREVHAACERVTGRTIPLVTAPRRPGDAPALVADPSRLKSQLGWTPAYQTIDDIVKSAWLWHQRYPRGYIDKKKT